MDYVADDAAEYITPLNRETAASWKTACSLLHCPSCPTTHDNDTNDNVLLQDTEHSTACGPRSCYPWLRNLQCSKCCEQWSICIDCSNVRKPFVSRVQVRRHNTRKHFVVSSPDNSSASSNKRPRLGVLTTTTTTNSVDAASDTRRDAARDVTNSILDGSGGFHNDDDQDDVDSTPVAGDEEVLVHDAAAEEVTFPFEGDRNTRYFSNDHRGLGVAYLVSQSQFGMDFLMDNLLQEDLSFQLHLASLISGMSRGQQKKFAVVMSKYHRVSAMKSEEAAKQLMMANRESNAASPSAGGNSHPSSEEAPSRSWFSRMPDSFQDLRHLYIEGRTSFIPNLPRPNVIRLQHHAYVSIIDCIADVLAHGLSLDTIKAGNSYNHRNSGDTTGELQPVSSPKNSESQHCRQIYDRAQSLQEAMILNRSISNELQHPLICLWINEWSDGFEPSYSVKANRGSAWLKTITICPPANKVHSLEYTYPIAVGKSTSSHEEVERLFADEITKLANNTEGQLFYHGTLKKNVRVHAELNVSLMDQPERRGSNYIMLGGGTYTSRWRHSANVAYISNKLQACDDCLVNVLLANRPLPQGMSLCQRCTCWRTPQDCGNTMLQYPVPDSYPPDMAPPSGTLLPTVISYEGLRFAAQMAHEKVFNGSWSMKVAKVFLRVEGMNSEAVNGITECANNCRKVFRSQPGSPDFVKLMEMKLTSPHDYAPWKIPALWARAGVTLDQHVDVPMHLLFLGITKTVVSMVQEWTLGRRKTSAFLRYANTAISLPARLGLDWCKAIPFGGGKMGGYVAENYLAVARLSNWFYSPIKLIAPSTIDEVGGKAENIINVIAALHAMISRLMSRKINDEHIRDCERHIHIFLSFFSKFDTDLRGENKRTWVRSYNFMSLLNLPDVLRKYGPLRNLWEGGGQGERILSIVKPTWNGYRKNWMPSMLDRMLRQMAIERITLKQQQEFGNQRISGSSPGIEEEHEYAPANENNTTDDHSDVILHVHEDCLDGRRNYVSYKSLENVRNDYERRLPLSVLRLRSGEFVCVIQRTTIIQILPAIQVVGVTEEEARYSCGNFFCWTLSETTPPRISSNIDQEISNFCILLPKLDNFGKPVSAIYLHGDDDDCDRQQQLHCQYTVIDSEWNVLHYNRSCWVMCHPHVPGASYEDNSGN